jgi:hypothetical protein
MIGSLQKQLQVVFFCDGNGSVYFILLSRQSISFSCLLPLACQLTNYHMNLAVGMKSPSHFFETLYMHKSNYTLMGGGMLNRDHRHHTSAVVVHSLTPREHCELGAG